MTIIICNHQWLMCFMYLKCVVEGGVPVSQWILGLTGVVNVYSTDNEKRNVTNKWLKSDTMLL